MSKIACGDSLELLRKVPDNYFSSIVTDPPYELGFMGKKWDDTGIANNVEFWTECLRVLKPGGHLLSFGGTRTYHRMACAIEDAGFEIRDSIHWTYGSGFPKSMNVGKAIDKMQGNEREDIEGGQIASSLGNKNTMDGGKANNEYKYTKGNSDWEGWGTALKPSHEIIVMARKPLSEKTVAKNVLKWGTGGINIDGCRVGTKEVIKCVQGQSQNQQDGKMYSGKDQRDKKEFIQNPQGRFPANTILSDEEEVKEMFPNTKSGGGNKIARKSSSLFNPKDKRDADNWKPDSGSASRFFYQIPPIIYIAKASKAERNKGCEDMEGKRKKVAVIQTKGVANDGEWKDGKQLSSKMQNHHPTVKPLKLMEYLIKLVTPPEGIVLDPFAGSGTTGLAAKNLGFDYVLLEKEEEYISIIENRLN